MNGGDFDRRTRLSITRFFESKGYAPTIDDIALMGNSSCSEIRDSFRRLECQHQISLCPSATHIRAAHPYSALPTAYWVESGHKGWWANCAFCALGVAVIAGKSARVLARLGAMNEAVTFHINDQHITPDSFRLHIPLPIREWHDDIGYTCANVHIFRNSGDIDHWAKTKRLPRGRDVSLADAWRLANTWYEKYLDDDWQPHTPETLRNILGDCGLQGAFWEPG